MKSLESNNKEKDSSKQDITNKDENIIDKQSNQNQDEVKYTVSKRIEKIRSFLIVNEIFFNIITALCLSGMALYLSYETNQFAKLQTKIAFAENQPNFYIDVAYIYNPETRKSSGKEIKIYNNSGQVQNLYSSVHSYLQITFIDSINTKHNKIVPLMGLYSGSFANSSNLGFITKHGAGDNNNTWLIALENRIEKTLEINGYKYPNIEEKSYLTLEYLDFMGNKTQSAFDVSFGTGKYIHNTNYIDSLKLLHNVLSKKTFDIIEYETYTENQILNRIFD